MISVVDYCCSEFHIFFPPWQPTAPSEKPHYSQQDFKHCLQMRSGHFRPLDAFLLKSWVKKLPTYKIQVSSTHLKPLLVTPAGSDYAFHACILMALFLYNCKHIVRTNSMPSSLTLYGCCIQQYFCSTLNPLLSISSCNLKSDNLSSNSSSSYELLL